MAIFYGGLAQVLAGMWDSGSEFVAGNTFGATSEYWRNSSITHSRPFRVGGFMVHPDV